MVKKKKSNVNFNLLSEEKKQRYLELSERDKIAKAELKLKNLEEKFTPKVDKRISVKPVAKLLKPLDKLSKPSKRIPEARFRPTTITPTQQQRFLMTFFNGQRTFGTGQNLPVINKTLTSGYGLIKHPQQDETGRLFGF